MRISWLDIRQTKCYNTDKEMFEIEGIMKMLYKRQACMMFGLIFSDKCDFSCNRLHLFNFYFLKQFPSNLI